MDDKEREFREHLLATFRMEADDHMRNMSSGLMEMEKAEDAGQKKSIIETVFREVHSLKGAARSVRLTDVEALCQAMENVFAALKRGEIVLSPQLFDLLYRSMDFHGELLRGAGTSKAGGKDAERLELMQLLEEAAQGLFGEAEPRVIEETVNRGDGAYGVIVPDSPESLCPDAGSPSQHPREVPLQSVFPAPTETVRVPTAKLSSVLLKSEEMLSAKLAAAQHVAQSRGAKAAFLAWKKEWGRVFPETRKLKLRAEKATGGNADDCSPETSRELATVLEFLEWNSGFFDSLEKRYAAELKTAKHDYLSLSGMVNNLQEDVMNLLMFPFSSLLDSFPRLVRDLSRDSGKDAELAVRGGEIEIDRRILEEMKDPLLHMIRNCIDHGIEKPAERRRKNKPEKGSITIAVSPKDDKVEVIVADDGAGIALDKVRNTALELGMVPTDRENGLSDQEVLPYVFQSGLSTSSIITEISGRGLGLAIVREKVEKLGGMIYLESEPDAGTRFHIVLPLTVAMLRGILVRVEDQAFIIPTMHVVRVLRLKRTDIGTVENRETVRIDGQTVSLVRLAAVLGLSKGGANGSVACHLPTVILNSGGASIAFMVDEVLGEQEVLMKNLGRQLSRVRNVAGATVLGSGRLVSILNVADLLKSAVRISCAAPKFALAGESAAAARKHSVMVVEDSITTRTLLHNILEAVGYDVVTAVDGIDALSKLKGAEFDVVVSDVEMPRMNGFDLTSRIRQDKNLADLPVVLVTALDSREDRERGIDVGANAYIVKGSFDQSDLLDAIKRLV